MIYVWFTIICASILQDDDQGESVALSLLCFENHTLLEFFNKLGTPSPRVTRILVPEILRVMRKPC